MSTDWSRDNYLESGKREERDVCLSAEDVPDAEYEQLSPWTKFLFESQFVSPIYHRTPSKPRHPPSPPLSSVSSSLSLSPTTLPSVTTSATTPVTSSHSTHHPQWVRLSQMHLTVLSPTPPIPVPPSPLSGSSSGHLSFASWLKFSPCSAEDSSITLSSNIPPFPQFLDNGTDINNSQLRIDITTYTAPPPPPPSPSSPTDEQRYKKIKVESNQYRDDFRNFSPDIRRSQTVKGKRRVTGFTPQTSTTPTLCMSSTAIPTTPEDRQEILHASSSLEGNK